MEIERKYFIETLPFDPEQYPFHQIEQAYLCTDPVVRVRREDDTFYLTYKSRGRMVREEYNLPLTEQAYLHLLEKADGRVLTKRRYLIPIEGTKLTIELDIFSGAYGGLCWPRSSLRRRRKRMLLHLPHGLQGMLPLRENIRTADFRRCKQKVFRGRVSLAAFSGLVTEKRKSRSLH